MTELSGRLDGVGLPAIVRFLSGLKKTGSLRIELADWQGEVIFEAGRLTSANFGSRTGLSALDGLVQVLPGGSFSFDTSPRPSAAPTIMLTTEGVLAHLNQLVARVASGTPSLPCVDAVPTLVLQAESGATEEPLPLDRGTLQTLLAVDGNRTVRQIVAQRGFDALWQLGSLAEVGLVRLGASGPVPRLQTYPDSPETPGSLDARLRDQAPAEVAAPLRAATPVVRSTESEVAPGMPAGRCPKLGFEDDASSSFARPTRLHRCFAAETPLPLSLDQQRELCLSDEFGTCPRLQMVERGGIRPPRRDLRNPSKASGAAGNGTSGPSGRVEAAADAPGPDHPRIVRWPIAGRNGGSARRVANDRHAETSSEAQPLPNAPAPRAGDSPRPTPLRARMEHPNSSAPPAATPTLPRESAGTTDAAPSLDSIAAPAHPHRTGRSKPVGRTANPVLARVAALPVPLLVGAATAVVALAALMYLFASQLGSMFVDDSADLSRLPNASAVAAGTSVAQVAPRRSPVTTTATEDASANAERPASAPVASTPAPEVVAAATVAVPPAVLSQPASLQTAASASPAAAQPGAPVVLFDERFTSNARNWPSDPQGTTWLTGGSYRLIPRRAGEFVAVGAPIADVPPDVSASATFRKLDGAPAGGGFGIILRDQGTPRNDGIGQGGRYYVLEVGDKGEVGIWRRDTDHWVDVLPWQHSDAVHPGTATNDLTVSAIGNRLSMTVNGTQVVTRTDAVLPTGGVGLLVGGDGNEVAVEHFSVQMP